MTLAFIAILMGLLWTVVTGSFTVLNLLLGLFLSLFCLWLTRGHLQAAERPVIRIGRILSLALLFFYELLLSAWRVAVVVSRRKIEVKPGIFAYKLTVTTDFQITLLANMITLTPGTLTVDVSEDRSTLYVHALDCSDPEGARRDIAGGFERKILEAFG